MKVNCIHFRRAVSVFVMLAAAGSDAANGVWTGAQSAYWTNSANWSVSPYPSGSSETAFFTNGAVGQAAINLNGLASIKYITFDAPSVAATTNGAGAANSQTLVINDSGEIKLAAAAGNSQTFNCGVQLGADRSAQSYSFRNENPARTLTLNNIFCPSAGGTAGAKTLNLNGSGTVAILGNITTNGTLGLTLTDNINSTVVLSGSNSFNTLNINGGANSVLDIGSGYLFLNNLGGTILSTSQGATINGSGTLRFSTSTGINYGDVRPAAGKTLVINPTIVSDGGFELNDAGTAVLNGTNTFNGDIYYSAAGAISVYRIGNRGSTDSNLGRGTNIIFNSSKLLYTGSGETSDRVVAMTNSATLEHAGTGLLKFTSATTASPGSRTLTLQGSSAGIGEFSGVVTNSYGTVALTKSGSGTWILSATNTYTGATTVNGGTLLISSSGSTAPGSAVTVNTGAVLGGSGTVNGTVTLASGAVLTPGDASGFGTLNLASNLTLNGCALLFDVDSTGAATDKVAVARTLTLSGTNTVYLSFPNGPLPIGTNTLMTYAAATGTGLFALAPGYGSAFLITNDTSVSLAVTNTDAYTLTWKGNSSDAWDGGAQNWTNGSEAVAFAEGDAVEFDDSAATFNVSSAGAVSPASVTFNNSVNAYAVSASIAGAAPVLKFGAAVTTISGNNAFTGPIAIGGGTLRIGGAGLLGGGVYSNAIVNAANLEYASSAAQTNSGVISGSGSLTVSGNGALTLSGNNSYGGPTALSGSGTLTLSGNSTCSGAITVFSGTLKALSPNALGTTGAGTTVSNGTLELAGGVSLAAEPLTLGGTLSSQTGTNTYTADISLLPGAVIDVGPASLLIESGKTLAGGNGFVKAGNGTLRLTGDPNQTGPFYVSAGTVELQHSGSTDASFIIAPGATLRENTAGDLGDNYSITNNGTLDLRASETIGVLAGSGLVTIGANLAYTLTVANDSRSGTFAGVIENGLGTLSLSKNGTGVQILSGANTYTGPTVLNSNSGTLLVNSPGSLASASVTVNFGSTLGGNGTISGPVTLVSGANLAPGGVGTVGTLTLGNHLFMTGDLLLCDLGTTAGVGDQVAVAGTLVLNGVNTVALAFPGGAAPAGDYTLMTFASKTGTGSFALLGSYPNASLELGATSLVLHVSGGGSTGLTWNGDLSNVWDGAAKNWESGNVATNFTNGSAVTFDDTAAGPYVGTIANVTNLAPSSVLFNSSVNSYTLSTNISGSAPLVKLGTATATLAGQTTYNPGSIMIGAGTLTLSAASRLNSGLYAGSIALNNGSFTFNSVGAQTLGGPISGVGSITLNGAGSLALTNANNTYSGGTTVSSGTLYGKNNATAFGTGALALKGGTLELDNDTTLAFNNAVTVSAAQAVKSGRLTAGSGVTHSLGALTLLNYTLTLSAGAAVNANSPYGLAFGASFVSNSVIDVSNNGTGLGTLTLGALSGNFAFTKQGAGTLYLGTASSRSAGTNILTAGTLKLGHASALGTANILQQLNGGTFVAAADTSVNAYGAAVGGNVTLQSDKATANSEGITHTLGTLTIGAFTLTVTNGANVRAHSPFGLAFGATSVSNSFLTVGNNGKGLGTMTLGPVSGAFALTKRGDGMLRLAGVNTHSGATTNSNGKLLVVTGGSSSNSSFTVQASGSADASAALSVFCSAANTQWLCTNLLFGAAIAPATNLPALDFSFAVLPSTNVAPLRVLNTVTFGTNPVVNVYLSNLTVPTNSYPLMVVGGTAPTAVPALNMAGGYTNSSLYWNGNTLMLQLSGTNLSLKWSPGVTGSGTWDLNNTANLVWTNGTAAAFYQEPLGSAAAGDAVLFDDSTLSAGSTVTLNTSFVNPSSMLVSNTLYSYTFTGSGAIAGPAGLTKTGTNLLTLATANAFTGAATVVAGTVALPAGGAINNGSVANAGLITVASAAGKAVLNITGGTVNATRSSVPSLQVGTVNGAVGVVNLSAGALNTVSELHVGAAGNGANGFGALNVSGGSVTTANHLTIGRGSSATGLNRGELLVSGGTLTVTVNNLEVGSYQNAVASTCVATLTGGTTTLGAGAGSLIAGNNNNGILTVSGSAAVNILSPSASLKIGGASGVTGIANLNGGVLTTPAVTKGSGTGYLNFDGGTLKANKSNASFMTGLTAVRLYGGGAVIDDGGYAITIAQPLLSPAAGNGVSLAGMSFSGSGFIAPPIVDVSGFGNGASAIATIDESGNLTGVTLTCPGMSYVGTPALSFTGGGGTVFQNGSAGTATNACGGLTKLGAGSLTLSAANTYSGPTVVNNGRLLLLSGGSCSNSAAIVQSSGSGAVATLGVRYTGANAQCAVAGLSTRAGIGGGAPDLEFQFSATPSATAAPLLVTGDATFDATPDVEVFLNGINAPAGAYPLLSVGGTAPAAVPTLTLIGGYADSTLSWSGNTLMLNLAGAPAPIKWSSGVAGTGTWDVNNSGNLIWKDATPAPTYYQELQGLPGDLVLFDDTYIGANTTVTLGTTVTPVGVAANNSGYTYTLSGAGAIAGTAGLTKSGAGLLKLSSANTYSGGTWVAPGGVLEVAAAGGAGTGAVTNDGTLNLTAGAGGSTDVNYSGLNNSLSGAGTNNVWLGTGIARMQLLGNYAGFVGVWNVGVGANAGASRAEMNGLDNAAATVNILTHATLWANSPGTHVATAVLYGGDTGESYGQLRVDTGTWAGPVILAGPMTGAGDGFFGAQNTNATISGPISEVGGPYEVSKVGAVTLTLSGDNTYLGPTAVKAGALRVPALGSVNGGPSPLGAPTTPAQGAVKLGVGTTAGTLVYAGMGETSDRLIDLAGTTGGAVIDQSGTNLFTLTGGMTASGAGAKTLTLQGSTIGTGEFAGVISNTPYGNAITVVKAGTGTWRLSSANTFTGGMTINGGTLAIAHPNALGTNGVSIPGTVGSVDLAHDGAGETINDYTMNAGAVGTLKSNRSSPGEGINHAVGVMHLSSATLYVTNGDNVVSGKAAVTADFIDLFSGAGGATTILAPTTADLIIRSGVSILSGGNTKTLQLDGTSLGSLILGPVTNGLGGTVTLTKMNTGTWTLSGSNTYSGTTTIKGGTLVLAGPDGALVNSSGLTVTTNAALVLWNNALSNNVNRLKDASAITLNGGAFSFVHDADSGDYSESAGPLSVTAGANTLFTSAAYSGHTSALTFASFARSGNATVNFIGDGLGESDRNRVFLTGWAEGPLGPWATVNGTNYAAYSSTLGVYVAGASGGATNIAARGPSSVIPNNAAFFAQINEPGEYGPIMLEGDLTNSILMVQQNNPTNAVIATVFGVTNKTLLASGLVIAADQGSLTLGENPGQGALSALTPGGTVLLKNDSSNALLTVNAAVANNGASTVLEKFGAGTVLLAGSNTYAGATTVNEGTLEFGGPFGQRLGNVIGGAGSLAKSGTNVLQLLGANTYAGNTYINAGMVRADKDATFGSALGTVYVADGATLNVGCTPDVGGTRTKDGINFGTKQFVVSGAGFDGQGAINNVSTASQYNAFSRIALSGDATFGASQRWDMRSSAASALDLNDHTLSKTGALDVAIHDVPVNPGAGNIAVNQGILRFEATTRVNGTADNTATVNSGATLELYNLAPYVPAWSLVLNGGSIFRGAGTNTSTNQNIWSGPVTLNGRAYFNAGSANIHWTVAGDISGPGTLVKAGSTPATLWLLSTNNTYSGGTLVSNGTLFAKCSGSLPGYSSGKVAVAGAATLAVQSGDGVNGWSAQQIKDLHDATVFSNNTAVLSIDTTLASIDYAGNLSKAIALTKRGNNTLTLPGTNTFTGALTVNGGTLNLPASSTNLTGAITVGGGATNASLNIDGVTVIGTNTAHTVVLAPTANDRSVATLSTNATIGKLFVANSAASAAFIQENGTLNVGPTIGGQDVLSVGNQGGYGYYRMLNGALNAGQLALVGSSGGGNGVFDLYNGTIKVQGAGGWFLVNWSTGAGVMNMFGGSLTTPAANDPTLAYSGNAANFAYLNLLGPSAFFDATAGGKTFSMAKVSGSYLSALNLNGGTLFANKITAVSGTPTVFGFNGGKLRANTTAALLGSLTAVNVYAGGATIDTTNAIVSVQSLLGPLGYGVSYIPLLTGGTNYIGAPLVKISGGSGVGATAIATVDLEEGSPTKGQVTGITITSTGSGYLATDTPTATLIGGGATLAATVGPCYLSPNTNVGGFTKLGSGTLVLAGTNSYGGETVISNGTLRLGLANSLPASAALTIAGGTYDLGGFVVTNGPVTLLSGAISNGMLNAALNKVGPDAASLSSVQGSATPVVVSGGALTLRPAPIRQPGLYESRVSGAFDLTMPNLQTAVKLSATNAYVYFGTSGSSGSIWVDNSTYIYSGFIWNNAATNENWTFCKAFDDSVLLRIDGNTVINDGTYSNTNLATYAMSPGPHALEVRLGQGTGSVGPVGSFPGIGFDRLGRNTKTAAFFQRLADPGDGSLLSLSAVGKTDLLNSNSLAVVEAGATLDLGGTTQTVAQVSGSGLVSNGTFSVTGSIAPGGTNVVGTLSLAAAAVTGGTLLVDVETDGSSDCLAVEGDINLSGLNLQIANLDRLNKGKSYNIVTCTGERTGTFLSNNLGDSRWRIVYMSSGTVRLVYVDGTLIRFM